MVTSVASSMHSCTTVSNYISANWLKIMGALQPELLTNKYTGKEILLLEVLPCGKYRYIKG